MSRLARRRVAVALARRRARADSHAASGRPASAVRFPAVEQFQLANGLKVILVEKHTLPVVEGRLILDAGAQREPAAKSGLASLTGSLLSEGDRDDDRRRHRARNGRPRRAVQHRRRVQHVVRRRRCAQERIPAGDVAGGEDGHRAELPGERIQPGEESGAGAVPAEPRADSWVWRPTHLSAPRSTAPRRSRGRPSGNPTTIGALTRDDVVNWHRSMFAPSAATLLLVGDITRS